VNVNRFWPSALIVALFAVSVHATTIIPTDLPDVVSSATLIVRGRVVDTRSFAEIANGPVMTAVTITNDEVLKGSAGSTITFRVHGGEIGRYRYVVIGSPTFSVGEQAYFFLKRSSAGALWPVGMTAGVYRYGVDGAVNAPVVAGVTATAGANVQRGDVRRKPIAMREFGSLVRMLMSAPPASTIARSRR
jgi:hypothetical protein